MKKVSAFLSLPVALHLMMAILAKPEIKIK